MAKFRVVDTKHIGTKVAITVEGPDPESVSDTECRAAVQIEAQKLMARLGLSGSSNVYPVNAAGACSDDVLAGKEPVAAYRQDFEYQGTG